MRRTTDAGSEALITALTTATPAAPGSRDVADSLDGDSTDSHHGYRHCFDHSAKSFHADDLPGVGLGRGWKDRPAPDVVGTLRGRLQRNPWLVG